MSRIEGLRRTIDEVFGPYLFAIRASSPISALKADSRTTWFEFLIEAGGSGINVCLCSWSKMAGFESYLLQFS